MSWTATALVGKHVWNARLTATSAQLSVELCSNSAGDGPNCICGNKEDRPGPYCAQCAAHKDQPCRHMCAVCHMRCEPHDGLIIRVTVKRAMLFVNFRDRNEMKLQHPHRNLREETPARRRPSVFVPKLLQRCRAKKAHTKDKRNLPRKQVAQVGRPRTIDREGNRDGCGAALKIVRFVWPAHDMIRGATSSG